MANNVVTFNPSQLPAFAQGKELSSLAKNLTGGGDFGKRLSIRGGVFRLISGGKEVAAIEERYFDVVIVAAAEKVGRTFYGAPYQEGVSSAPRCWSADGDFPDESVSKPQSVSCGACPQNQKGSGQGTSRACRYSKRIAVVPANDIEGDVLQLNVPAASLFGDEEGDNRPLQSYAKFLAAQKADPNMVITRMRFDTTAQSPKLFFKAMRWLEQEEYDVCVSQGDTKEAQDAIVTAFTHTVETQAPVQREEAPVMAPKVIAKAIPAGPAGDDEEAPPPAPKMGRPKGSKNLPKAASAAVREPEPEVRRAASAEAAVPTRKGLLSTIADWDE